MRERNVETNSGDMGTGRAREGAMAVALAAQPDETPVPAPAQQAGQAFFDELRSGGQGPEMVVIPAGQFRMGCVSGDSCEDDEFPVHEVTIPRTFAVSKYEVTFEDYDRSMYPNRAEDWGRGRGRRPAIFVSWDDARDYLAWLSEQTGETYRLLSEAE